MVSDENSAWLTLAKSLGLIFYAIVLLTASVVSMIIALLICVLIKRKR